jgi:hypothetical protein
MNKQFVYIHQSSTGYGFLVNAEDDTLATLQALVDGLIECVYSKEYECDVWVNEEGLFREDFEVNMVAGRITNRVLVGPAVLANSDSEGATTGIKPAQMLVLQINGLYIDDNDGAGWTVAELLELIPA